MFTFEVGKQYEPNDYSFDPIKVTKRTAKTIWVDNGTVQFMMRVRKDDDGNEYATDSTVPGKWRIAFTYQAKHII